MVFYENNVLVNVSWEAKWWMGEKVFANFGVDTIFVEFDLRKAGVGFV